MALDNKMIMVMDKETHKFTERFHANYPNLNSLRGFLDGQWNLALFDECFSGRNRLGDVDASIEIGSYTLLIEFKGARNGMNKGQVLKALRQAKYSGITTFFVFGKRDNPEAYLTIEPDADSPKGYKSSGYIEANLESVRAVIKDWSDKAEANNRVKSKTEEWKEVTSILSSLYA